MRLVELAAWKVTLPLKQRIRHASHDRDASTNVVVRCRTDKGVAGWGEGVPRPYVTGETPDSCLQRFAEADLGTLEGDLRDWPDVIAAVEAIGLKNDAQDLRGCSNNALRCAIELAVLDAAGQTLEEPLSVVIDHVPEAKQVEYQRPEIRYSTTITAMDAWAQRKSAIKMRVYDFRQCKIKVGVPDQDDIETVARLRKWLGRRCNLRVDANEAWDADTAIRQIRRLEPFRITAVEQPLPHEDIDQLPAVRAETRTPIMLDESCTSAHDVTRAIDEKLAELLNIRLSKCGGYIACLRMAAQARAAGLGYQLGCHPGESPILSAAGRHWACTVGGTWYLEGSYDRHLLTEILAEPDITFRYGGLAPAINRPGLGITVNETALLKLASDPIVRTLGPLRP
ncbi:MAG: dipeptide epimerase [Planctomycetota bacterium]